MQVVFFVYLYLYYHWRSSYQEGMVDISINLFNHATCLYPSPARTLISNLICRGVFIFIDLRWDVIVGFDGIGGFWAYRWRLIPETRHVYTTFEGLFQKPVVYSTFDIYVFINHQCLNFLCIFKPGDTMVILPTKCFENLNIIFVYCSNKDVYILHVYTNPW